MSYSRVFVRMAALERRRDFNLGMVRKTEEQIRSEQPFLMAVGEAVLHELEVNIAQIELELGRLRCACTVSLWATMDRQYVAPFYHECSINDDEIPF